MQTKPTWSLDLSPVERELCRLAAANMRQLAAERDKLRAQADQADRVIRSMEARSVGAVILSHLGDDEDWQGWNLTEDGTLEVWSAEVEGHRGDDEA